MALESGTAWIIRHNKQEHVCFHSCNAMQMHMMHVDFYQPQEKKSSWRQDPEPQIVVSEVSIAID